MFKRMIAALSPLTVLLVLVGVLLLPLPVQANSIAGQCSDCHTMHNSEQGQAVALKGLNATVSNTPNQSLLKFDCIACHAQNTSNKIVTMPGGSTIPQVYHQDATGDLAAGNFAYISGTKPGHEGTFGNRKGHNVVDLVDPDPAFAYPPGMEEHGDNWGGVFRFDASQLTCAGNMGCHGLRGQKMDNGSYRRGLNALRGRSVDGTYFSGSHHDNYDGLKSLVWDNDAEFVTNEVAHSYRFIVRLSGYGNEIDRWQNLDSDSHNEYHGGYADNFIWWGDQCSYCHTVDTWGGDPTEAQVRATSRTMTGFCITCHTHFHSTPTTSGSQLFGDSSVSASGAFLRHPSDYVIPNSGEYAAYTEYNISAPVARPWSFFSNGMSPGSAVQPGRDMVMCLSCHMVHASPYDGMLRFDYSQMVAGGSATNPGVGCLACHTTKGVAGD